MAELVRRAFSREPIVVGPGIRTGMSILYENPREVGADRIVNAVAAYEWAKSGVIVVDFGTATTFDCVTPKGEYLGGVITPGVQISAEALFARAARLSRVEIALPPKVVGRNPVHSMQSGIVYGYAGLVDGLCARLKKELGYPCRVVATGGLAKLIAPQTEAIEAVDNDLTLTGLRILGLDGSAVGRTLEWRRDTVDMYAFHVDVPQIVRPAALKPQPPPRMPPPGPLLAPRLGPADGNEPLVTRDAVSRLNDSGPSRLAAIKTAARIRRTPIERRSPRPRAWR